MKFRAISESWNLEQLVFYKNQTDLQTLTELKEPAVFCQYGANKVSSIHLLSSLCSRLNIYAMSNQPFMSNQPIIWHQHNAYNHDKGQIPTNYSKWMSLFASTDALSTCLRGCLTATCKVFRCCCWQHSGMPIGNSYFVVLQSYTSYFMLHFYMVWQLGESLVMRGLLRVSDQISFSQL